MNLTKDTKKIYYFGDDVLEFNPDGKPRYKLNGKPMLGVTTVLGVINKETLKNWAAKMALLKVKQWIEEGLEIIKNINKMIEDEDYPHKKRLKEAGDFGTLAHNYIEHYAKWKLGEMDEPGEPSEEIINIVVPAINWLEGSISLRPKRYQYDKNSIEITPTGPAKILRSEQVVYSKVYGYAGTFDLVLEIDGKKYITDFKTSGGIYGLEYWLQLAAYRHALEEMGVDKDFAGSIILRSGSSGNDLEVRYSTTYTEMFKGFLAALYIYFLQSGRDTSIDLQKPEGLGE